MNLSLSIDKLFKYLEKSVLSSLLCQLYLG